MTRNCAERACRWAESELASGTSPTTIAESMAGAAAHVVTTHDLTPSQIELVAAEWLATVGLICSTLPPTADSRDRLERLDGYLGENLSAAIAAHAPTEGDQ